MRWFKLIITYKIMYFLNCNCDKEWTKCNLLWMLSSIIQFFILINYSKLQEVSEIQIIESFIKGKINEDLCEDILFISEDFIAIIDGVTSKSDFLYQNQTTGKLASTMIRDVLLNANKEDTLHQIIKKVNAAFKEFYEKVAFPYSKTEKGLQAACVIYSDFYNEIWMVGDCQAAVDGMVYINPKVSDTILSETRSLVMNTLYKEAGGNSSTKVDDTARNIILPWILKSTIYANDASSHYGYSVFNGENIPMELVKIIKLDHKHHEIVLTSDGYPSVKQSLKESEDELAKVLKEDPECYKYYRSTKGTKVGQVSFDDRAYVRFTIN